MGMGIFGKTFLFAIVSFFAYMAALVIVAAKNEAECLGKGYSQAYVTWNFDKYCGTLDGAVTVRVVKQ